MEHMSAELQFSRDQKLLEIQRAEREWFDSETKRMDVEGKIMMTDAQLQSLIQQNLAIMLGKEAEELNEEEKEFEAMEEANMQQPASALPEKQPHQIAAGSPAVKQKPGAMTRKPNVAALTGEQKPEQQNEM